MINEKNQILSKKSFVAVVFFLALIGATVIPFLDRPKQIQNPEQNVQAMAFGLGQQLLAESIKMPAVNELGAQQRGIASIPSAAAVAPTEGLRGTDPWGKPFHYKFIKNNSNVTVAVAVWSDGKDQKSDTNPGSWSIENAAAIQFAGDDAGAIIPVR